MVTAAEKVSPVRQPPRLVRGLASLILLLLVAQFLFGMAVNLFVTIPAHHPGANPPEYFGGVVQSVRWAILESRLLWLVIHASAGLLLVALSIVFLIVAIISRRGRWILAGALGFFGVTAAGFNGGSFLNYHQDFSSMLMAGGFAVAVVGYLIGALVVDR
jgi:hypothetical protein